MNVYIIRLQQHMLFYSTEARLRAALFLFFAVLLTVVFFVFVFVFCCYTVIPSRAFVSLVIVYRLPPPIFFSLTK